MEILVTYTDGRFFAGRIGKTCEKWLKRYFAPGTQHDIGSEKTDLVTVQTFEITNFNAPPAPPKATRQKRRQWGQQPA